MHPQKMCVLEDSVGAKTGDMMGGVTYEDRKLVMVKFFMISKMMSVRRMMGVVTCMVLLYTTGLYCLKSSEVKPLS